MITEGTQEGMSLTIQYKATVEVDVTEPYLASQWRPSWSFREKGAKGGAQVRHPQFRLRAL